MLTPLPPDPYKTLGVSKDAQIPEIKQAYRKKALTCHPDKVQDEALKPEKLEEFQRLQQAYELLNNETERAKYDDQIRYMELRKEMAKNLPNTSAPRTPQQTRHFNVDIRTAEPRSSSFGQSPIPPPGAGRMYAQYQPSRSDDYLYVDPKGIFSESRSARKSSSYEKPSRKDDDRERRRRQREKEKEREREEEEEREREKRALEKEVRRVEKKRAEKRAEKERKAQSEDKRSRHRHDAYVESYDEDDVATPKSDKKKSSSGSRKHEEKRDRSTPREAVKQDLAEKYHEELAAAYSYIKAGRSKGIPTMPRAATFTDGSFHLRNSPPSVPTPPPARDSPFGPVDDEEVIRRSQARAAARRPSYDTSKSKERGSSHKKSHSGPKEHPGAEGSPVIVDVQPEAAHPSPSAPEPHRTTLPRASTFHEAHGRPAAQPVPGIPRAHTFAGESGDSRGRSRSRLVAQVESVSEEDEPEESRRHRDSRKHRSSRRTQSPEIPYAPSRHQTKHYSVEERGAIPRESSYRQAQEAAYDRAGYYPGMSGVRAVKPRPGMPDRESSYSTRWKVHEARRYKPEDVSYGSYGSMPVREEVYGYS